MLHVTDLYLKATQMAKSCSFMDNSSVVDADRFENHSAPKINSFGWILMEIQACFSFWVGGGG